jgi:hypothetical protein
MPTLLLLTGFYFSSTAMKTTEVRDILEALKSHSEEFKKKWHDYFTK